MPFGKDLGVAGASLARMPARRDPVPGPDIDLIEQWIDDGCPDDVPVSVAAQSSLAAETSRVSYTTAPSGPTRSCMSSTGATSTTGRLFHATDEVRAAIEAAFATAWPSMDYAKDENQKQTWLAP